MALIIAVVCFALVYQNNILMPVSAGTDSSQYVRYGIVVFNELMLSNGDIYPDKDGNFYDYCELHNTLSSAVDLSGFEIYDKKTQKSWKFPDGTVIDADGYIVLFFCGESKGGLYVDIKLSKSGGQTLYLRDADGTIIDMTNTFAISQNSVLERQDNGTWRETAEISPLFPNTDEGKSLYLSSREDMSYPVKISEIMAKNTIWITDSDWDFSDYIEITNYGSEAVDLESFTLTNDPENIYKWAFPSVKLNPGKSIVVFASGKDRVKENSEFHLSFKLDNEGESLYLYKSGGVLIDSVVYTGLEENCVYSRTAADGDFKQTRYPSPGYQNSDEGITEFLEKFAAEKAGIIINEVMVYNDSYVVQNGGEYYDWIELKNVSSKPIDLGGYYLAVSEKNPFKQQLPSKMLAPGETYVVFASGENKYTSDAYFHCNFKLDSDGETLYLFSRDYSGNAVFADGCLLYNIPYGYSYGRGLDGYFVYIDVPTPYEENGGGLLKITEIPEVSVPAGVYNNTRGLTVSLEGEGRIYYTTDGSIPDETSFLYSGPLSLASTTAVKVIAYCDGKVSSAVKSYSYIINENHSVAVLSVTVDPVQMFDEKTGICARGEPDENGVYPKDANVFQNTELAASAELFEPDGGSFCINCGIKLFGQSNRTLAKQSFQLKFKIKYGSDALYYPLFESRPEISRFDTVVLRSGSQDYRRAMMRDELCTSLAEGFMDLIAQAYKPCVLYINGEYWGLYYLREKIDEDWISSLYNVSSESVSIVRGNGEEVYGDPDDFYSLMWCVRNYELSDQSKYEYVKKLMDVESFADFVIAQAFFGNRDSGNIKIYKSTETDNKWRWVLFDLDYGLADDPTFGLFYVINPEGTGYMKKYNTDLINSLLKNAEFRDMFLTRFAYHLDNTFGEERVTAEIDALKAVIEPEMKRNISKWGYDMSSWKWQVSQMKGFVTEDNGTGKTRKEQLLEEIRTVLGLSEEEFEHYFGTETEEA